MPAAAGALQATPPWQQLPVETQTSGRDAAEPPVQASCQYPGGPCAIGLQIRVACHIFDGTTHPKCKGVTCCIAMCDMENFRLESNLSSLFDEHLRFVSNTNEEFQYMSSFIVLWVWAAIHSCWSAGWKCGSVPCMPESRFASSPSHVCVRPKAFQCLTLDAPKLTASTLSA